MNIHQWPPVLRLLTKCPDFYIDRGGANLGALSPRFPQWPLTFSDEKNVRFGFSIPLGISPRETCMIYIERATVSVMSAVFDEAFIKKIPPGPGNLQLKGALLVESCRYHNQFKEWHKPFIDTFVAVATAPDDHMISRYSRQMFSIERLCTLLDGPLGDRPMPGRAFSDFDAWTESPEFLLFYFKLF